MAGKVLMTGNEAAAEAAILAGCRFYYGYPITPQNEIPAYMSKRMPEVGGTFIQAESELAAISMVHGTSAAGKRAMTSSSSPGMSLKQEGISYLAGSELPAVIVNVQRGGPGLGDIRTSQADYFQATRGGGHGDYRTIVLAPDSVQEMADLTQDAFDLADKYRTPVIVLADARIGQMMEPVEFSQRPKSELPPKDWALTGAKGRPRNIVKSFYWIEGDLEKFNLHLQKKYRQIEEKEPRWEEVETEDAEVIVAAYGTAARISKEALRVGRGKGIKIGLFRPITLWPFPRVRLRELAETTRAVLVAELSAGQMIEDVRLSLQAKVPVDFLGRLGGAVPTSTEILEKVENILQETTQKVR